MGLYVEVMCDVPEEDVATIYGRIYRAMIQALIEEVTVEAGR